MKTSLLLLVLVLTTPCLSQLLPVDSQWVEQTLRSMSLEQKIGQLFMPVHRGIKESEALIRDYHIGGLWFAWTEAGKITRELNTLQEISPSPLLIAVDFEKGAGTYVDGATDLPINMALGATRNPELVYRAASLTAREARAMGVHVNFAPVLDVNNNPLNPVINIRSYSEDPSLVAQLGVAAIKGYQENGLLATGKHFPGHGNTATDSHSHLGTVEGSRSDVDATELAPYREVLKKTDLAAIMTAHLWFKALDRDTIPATLSPRVMTNLLRKELKFDRLLFTDAMVMGGITTRYPFDEAVIRALDAGGDIILFPGSMDLGFKAIKSALKAGQLTETRIDASVRRILAAKTKVGLHKTRTVDAGRVKEIVGSPAHYDISKSIAAECLTLVGNEGEILPLDPKKKTAIITFSNREGNSMLSRGLVTFPDHARSLAASVVDLRLSDNLTASEVASAVELAGWADQVVLAAYVKIVLNSGTVELSEAQKQLIARIAGRNPNVVLVSFGNPYIGGNLQGIAAYVCAYDNTASLQEVAATALYRRFSFKGKLPVTISEKYGFGWGLQPDQE